MQFLLLLMALIGFASPAFAGRLDSADDTYRRAFAALDAGQYDAAFRVIGTGYVVPLNTVLLGYAMARPGNGYSFDELANFVTDHPDWPNLKDILMITEQKLPSDSSAEQVVNWFTTYPPLTPAGFYRYIDALRAMGKSAEAAQAIRTRWLKRSFAEDEMTAFYANFYSFLTQKDVWDRADSFLWSNNPTAVKALFPYLKPGEKALAEARMALAAQSSTAESLLSKVPSALRSDPGLLYERLRWRRKNNQDDDAIGILEHAPEKLVRPDLWWDERNIMARRAMEKHDFAQAYRLIAKHGLKDGFDYCQAEFTAGWLALRFLNKPALAQKHFTALANESTTPVTRARAAYWLGRTAEAIGDKRDAEQHYETAAAFTTTYYGQLATTRLYAAPQIQAAPEPTIPNDVRKQFFANIHIQAIDHLARIGQMGRAKSFFKAATDAGSQRVEFALLTEQAYRLGRPDWAINAAKAAAQKSMLLTVSAYPVLSMQMPAQPEPALTHALIRQESLFNADAGSPVGARGLMQLMPKTAEGLARKMGIPYQQSDLTDPDKNVRLGTLYIQQQIDQFDGSYILSLAGYNAGPRRAREWMTTFGDPRTPQVDPIDWVELIPIYETRNYVQRIIENLQFYRARLNGGKAQLQILQDLKR